MFPKWLQTFISAIVTSTWLPRDRSLPCYCAKNVVGLNWWVCFRNRRHEAMWPTTEERLIEIVQRISWLYGAWKTPNNRCGMNAWRQKTTETVSDVNIVWWVTVIHQVINSREGSTRGGYDDNTALTTPLSLRTQLWGWQRHQASALEVSPSSRRMGAPVPPAP